MLKMDISKEVAVTSHDPTLSPGDPSYIRPSPPDIISNDMDPNYLNTRTGKPPTPPPMRDQSKEEAYMKPVPPLYFNESPPTDPSIQPFSTAPPPGRQPTITYPSKIPPSAATNFPDDPQYRPVPAEGRPQTPGGPQTFGRPFTSNPRFRSAKMSTAATSISSAGSVSSRKGSSVKFDAEAIERSREHGKSSRKMRNKADQMDFLVDEVPPWYLCILLGFQHYLIMFGATAANPLVLAPSLCIANSDAVTKGYLIQTIFVVAGIVTFLQATFGVRLPIVQGGTFTFVAPSLALLNLPQWKCDGTFLHLLSPAFSQVNATAETFNATDDYTESWQSRMREVQGAIIVASLFEVLIGFSGIMGVLLRFIGPLSVAPTISMAGLSLFNVALDYSSQNWWITLVTVILIAAFSQYTKNISIPCFHFERGKGFRKVPFPVFRLFPVILAISIAWILTAILEATKVFQIRRDVVSLACNADLQASDLNDVLQYSPWFSFPYPGQWGVPTVSVAGVFGMLAGVLANMVESVGDYYACARISGATPPPYHAINRGIGVEGLGCILAGAWGSGSGTTSYSENIGAIGITKVSSRRVIQCAACIMIIFGLFGKLGTLFILIPRPIIGGIFIVMFGMVAAVGISNLQFVNLNSSRNLFIIGFSFFFGLQLPRYLGCNQGIIQTGSPIADQIFTVLLSTSMFVGGMSAFILDNTIPGTAEERGLSIWKEHDRTSAVSGASRYGNSEDERPEGAESEKVPDTYDVPFIGKYLEEKTWSRFIPFLQSFDETLCVIKKRKKKVKRMQPRQTRRSDDSSGTDEENETDTPM